VTLCRAAAEFRTSIVFPYIGAAETNLVLDGSCKTHLLDNGMIAVINLVVSHLERWKLQETVFIAEGYNQRRCLFLKRRR